MDQYSNAQIEGTPKLAEASIIVPINYPKMEQCIPLHLHLQDLYILELEQIMQLINKRMYSPKFPPIFSDQWTPPGGFGQVEESRPLPTNYHQFNRGGRRLPDIEKST